MIDDRVLKSHHPLFRDGDSFLCSALSQRGPLKRVVNDLVNIAEKWLFCFAERYSSE